MRAAVAGGFGLIRRTLSDRPAAGVELSFAVSDQCLRWRKLFLKAENMDEKRAHALLVELFGSEGRDAMVHGPYETA